MEKWSPLRVADRLVSIDDPPCPKLRSRPSNDLSSTIRFAQLPAPSCSRLLFPIKLEILAPAVYPLCPPSPTAIPPLVHNLSVSLLFSSVQVDFHLPLTTARRPCLKSPGLPLRLQSSLLCLCHSPSHPAGRGSARLIPDDGRLTLEPTSLSTQILCRGIYHPKEPNPNGADLGEIGLPLEAAS